MRIVLLVLFLVFAQLTLTAQDAYQSHDAVVEVQSAPDESRHDLVAPAELETTQAYQAENITVRKFDEAKWKEIVDEIDYHEAPAEQEAPGYEPLSLPWAAPLLKVISYLVIIAIVVLLLYYIAKNVTFGQKIQRTKFASEDLEKVVDDIEELDIEVLLAQARREGNFKMAVRLYYLGLLKKLNTLGMIVWKKEKTNRDYLSELFLKDFYYPEVQKLTVSYEAVWYGEHAIQDESFDRLTQQFEAVYQKINTPKTP